MLNRSKNTKLSKTKTAKNDVLYTQYSDIEKEIQAHLEFNPDVFRDKTVLLPRTANLRINAAMMTFFGPTVISTDC